ncbi:hypothetical protein [Polaromonas sp.]|uniref:CopG family ribbon-helix-helix protein n=1 Tax=Polaromonas sp. TaxID=1869339 RepID=UPI00286D22B8|nr:hypothetical protein [Polaromonas sp.]
MPIVSVKLAEATKERVNRLAASQGTTAHALMVGAIESALDSQEKHGAFVEAALRSRDHMLASAQAFDGDEFAAYIRAKVRGQKVKRPRPKSIKSLAQQKA